MEIQYSTPQITIAPTQGNQGSEATQTVKGQGGSFTEISLENTKSGDSAGSKHLDTVLPKPSTVTPKNAATTVINLGAVSADAGSVDMFAMMQVFQKLAQQMRDTARTQRSTEAQGQVNDLLNAADKMKAAADLRLAGAIVQGAIGIAGGVTQMASATASLGMTVKAAAAGPQSIVTASGESKVVSGFQSSAGQVLAAKAESTSKAGAGLSQTLGGFGGIVSAGLERGAAEQDAERSKLEARSKMHETNAAQANEMMQQMMEVIRDVREKMQSMQQTQIESNRGIARNI